MIRVYKGLFGAAMMLCSLSAWAIDEPLGAPPIGEINTITRIPQMGLQMRSSVVAAQMEVCLNVYKGAALVMHHERGIGSSWRSPSRHRVHHDRSLTLHRCMTGRRREADIRTGIIALSLCTSGRAVQHGRGFHQCGQRAVQSDWGRLDGGRPSQSTA